MATCTQSRETNRTTPSPKFSCSSAATSTAVTPTISTSCTTNASRNLHTVPRDKPRDPRHHVHLHVRRRHTDKQRQLHAKQNLNLAHRPAGQTATPPPPCPPPRPPPPRRQPAPAARQTQAATCTPSHATNRTAPVTTPSSTSAATTPRNSANCTPNASGNLHAVVHLPRVRRPPIHCLTVAKSTRQEHAASSRLSEVARVSRQDSAPIDAKSVRSGTFSKDTTRLP